MRSSNPVIVLAGRRIDAEGARPPRFPLQNVDLVRDRIRALLVQLNAAALVSSAACGADLLALDAAAELGLRRRIVLPFDRRRFRETSVIDRPGGQDRWGPLFDRILAGVPAADIITLHEDGDDTTAYTSANARILDEACMLADASGSDVMAIIAWDGKPRGADDLTVRFAQSARERGMPVHEVPTR